MLYSFSLEKETIEKYQSIIPISQHKKIFREFLLNDYHLPENLKQLEENVTNVEIITLRFNEVENAKFDNLLLQAKQKGFNLSRSSLMRDIYKQIIDKYKDENITEREFRRQTFKVPVGTKNRLSKFVQDRTRTYELSSFILEEYTPSNNFTSMRGQEQENFDFRTDIEVFEKLDLIAEEYGFKKGGRAKIFRDALTQFEEYVQQYSPKQQALEYQLEKLITEYKDTNLNDSVLREKINKYLE